MSANTDILTANLFYDYSLFRWKVYAVVRKKNDSNTEGLSNSLMKFSINRKDVWSYRPDGHASIVTSKDITKKLDAKIYDNCLDKGFKILEMKFTQNLIILACQHEQDKSVKVFLLDQMKMSLVRELSYSRVRDINIELIEFNQNYDGIRENPEYPGWFKDYA